jgi:hypothetical protein
VAVLTGVLTGPKQNVSLIMEIKWKGEKGDIKERVKLPVELTPGRPTGLRLLGSEELVVENGDELTGLKFGLSDGHNTLGEASEVTLMSDDVSIDGHAQKKVRPGQSVRISCLDRSGKAEKGVRDCIVTATYKEKGKDGQELSVDFEVKVLPG